MKNSVLRSNHFNFIPKSIRFGSASLCLLAALLANKADAQTYFGVTGGITTGQTYSWDAANWGTGTGGPFTSNWSPAGFARFTGGAGDNYTVTINASESMSGMWQDASGATLNINDAGNGTGFLNVSNGVQGFLLSGALIINAPITGVGTVNPQWEASGGAISLFGDNTYSGGTELTSSSALVNFNNNNSFGSGTITVDEAAGSYAPLLSTGGSTITLANNFANSISGGGVNFASSANTPVVSSGNWSLGANNINIRNNGNGTAPLTISGVISGSGAATFSGANGGTIFLNNVNTFTGPITNGVSGDAILTLRFGVANAIANSARLTMNGGTLNPGGFNQIMPNTTLGLRANSTIDFGVGGSELDFANSSALAWSGVLDLTNFSFSLDALRIGTTSSGATTAQLGDIDINGVKPAELLLSPTGYLEVPEPSPALLGMAGAMGLVWIMRRRKA